MRVQGWVIDLTHNDRRSAQPVTAVDALAGIVEQYLRAVNRLCVRAGVRGAATRQRSFAEGLRTETIHWMCS